MVSHGVTQPRDYVALLESLAQQFDACLVALALQADNLGEHELEILEECVQSRIGGRR